MAAFIKDFTSNESGAVTVDWVVLTAGMVGLCLAVITVVGGGTEDFSGELQASLVAADPLNDPFAGDNSNRNDSID